MATMKPLKIIGSLLSNFAPIIEIIKIENDKIAESIQKKQYALIFKNIIFINKKLNVDDAQEIRNTNHHKNLFCFSFGEIKLSESIIVITNIDKYVMSPANDRGILTLLFSNKVPQGLFKTVSQPFCMPGHESEVNNPQFFKVIEPVSTMPIVLRIAIMIFGHFKSFLFLLFKVLRAIKKESLLFTLSILILSWHESFIRNAF